MEPHADSDLHQQEDARLVSDSGLDSVSRGSIMMMTSDAGGGDGGSYTSQSIGASRLPLLPGAGDASRPTVTGTALISASASSSSSTISRSRDSRGLTRDSRRREGAERLADNGCHVIVLCARDVADCPSVVADCPSVVADLSVVADCRLLLLTARQVCCCFLLFLVLMLQVLLP